ncbi:MAG: hypothetical protein R3185_00650 [Candidatus Thermoplasmatota archaeon]|nr:hypothetical protein [Candidatus Thermoplasmatota archaeon]
MDQTTRALTVLATITLLAAPLVNGILAEAATTADRLFLRDADWEGDPPLPEDWEGDPPEGDPPEGEPPDELPEGGEGPAPQPNCTVEGERPPAAAWSHQDPSEGAGSALISRVAAPQEQRFDVEDRHLGMGIRLNVTDLRGALRASVYPEGSPDEPVFEYRTQNRLGDDVETRSTHTRNGELTTGTWVARLETTGASYAQLQFIVVLASCQASQEGAP